MPPLADLQGRFGNALLDADLSLPGEVIAPDGGAAGKRFNVYRNNVAVSLSESLAAVYPVVMRLVGEAFFRGAAGIYIRREPPRSPIMIDYGKSFGAFLDTFEPAQSVPYLGDVARLEWAWNRSYYAVDAPVFEPTALASIAEEDLGSVGFDVHPAARLVRSRFPVVSLFHANRGDVEAGGVRLPDGGEDALVTRPEYEVNVTALAAGGGLFFEALATGLPLSAAASKALGTAPEFDLSTNLSKLLRAGAFSALAGGGEPTPQTGQSGSD